MKTIYSLIPLYLFAFIALVLLLKSLYRAFFPAKINTIDLAVILDESENNELYKTFSK